MEYFILNPDKRRDKLSEFPYDKFDNMRRSEIVLTNKVVLIREGRNSYIYKKTNKEYNELELMNSIKNIINISPNFCLPYGNIRKMMLMEYAGDVTMKEYFQSVHGDENKIFSCILQVIMALYYANERYSFTHYDMHTDNIHLIRCNKNVVFIYKINGEYLYVPTYGYIPVILDYEFGYTRKLEGNPLRVNVRNIDAGFLKVIPSKYTDLKVFLCNVSYDLITNEIDDTSSESEIEIPLDDDDDLDAINIELLDTEEEIPVRKEVNHDFRDYVVNSLSSLDIDYKSGLNNYEETNDFPLIMYNTFENIININISHDDNKLFSENFTDVIQEILTLSTLGEIKKARKDTAKISLKIVLKEFGKIQKCTKDKEMAFRMLKDLIDVITVIKDKFIKNRKKKYIEYVSCEFLYRVDKYAKFVNPTNLKYENLIIAMIGLSRYFSYSLYRCVSRMKNAEKELCDEIELLNFIKAFKNIKNKYVKDYTFTPETIVYLWSYDDKDNGNTILKREFKKSKYYNLLNTVEEEKIGKLLYNIVVRG